MFVFLSYVVIFYLSFNKITLSNSTFDLPKNLRNFRWKFQIIKPKLKTHTDLETSPNVWQKAIVTIRQDVNITVIHDNCVVAYQENLSSVSKSTFFAHGMTSALKPKRMEVESFGPLLCRLEPFPK